MRFPTDLIFHLVVACVLAFSGCSCKSNDGGTRNDPDDGGVILADGAVPPPGVCNGNVCTLPDGGIVIPTPDGGTTSCYLVQCANHLTACGDCSDNDGDGLIDFQDPECLGPCDNYEGEELFSGVGGEGGEQCKADCYFDFGNGSGNDTCKWHRSCDPLEPKEQCTYKPNKLGGKDCPDEQTELCHDYCGPLTPNGCDCFGCCEFPELATAGPGGGQGYVYIGSESGCTFETVTDPASCQPCTPVADCLNDCGRCEICLGKPTIPPDCIDPPDGGMNERCPGTLQPCGLPGDDLCPAETHFCVTGCCTPTVE